MQDDAARYVGYVDEVSHKHLYGWVLNRDDPGTRVPLDVYLNNQFYIRISPSFSRPDLQAVQAGVNCAGYSVDWDLPTSSGPLSVSVRISGTNQELNGSPVHLGEEAKKLPAPSDDALTYTEDTKQWLDGRYQLAHPTAGIYLAHQPIYGWGQGFSDPGLGDKYLTSYHILRVLAGIKFNSFLDAGGGEGYTAALVQKFFKCKVTSSDLSAQACKRANAIFGIESVPNDIHALQFEDNSFDVVLCSESLEHVARPFDAIAELIRVAKTAVIITVPHESQADVAKSVAEGTPHGHINYFDLHSFEYLKNEGYAVSVTPVLMRTGITNWIYALMECSSDGFSFLKNKRIVSFFLATAFFWRKVIGKRLTAQAMRMDVKLGHDLKTGWYGGVCCAIFKNGTPAAPTSQRQIDPMDVLNFSTPFHRSDDLQPVDVYAFVTTLIAQGLSDDEIVNKARPYAVKKSDLAETLAKVRRSQWVTS